MLEYRVSHLTDIGRLQKGGLKKNEDSKFVDRARNIYYLADGMGAHGNGKLASEQAINLSRINMNLLYKILQHNPMKGNEIKNYMATVVRAVNRNFNRISKNIEQLAKFGTTLDICFVYKDRFYIAHVGDSRVYRVNKNGPIDQITKDDAAIGFPLEEFPLEERKVVVLGADPTSYIGKNRVTIRTYSRELHDDDTIIMASDGLNVVDDSEIAGIVGKCEFRKIPYQLIKRANNPERIAELYAKRQKVGLDEAKGKLGGNDNLTVIVINAYKK